MKVIILGSSGSLGAPDNPASGYLVQVDNAPSIIMDIGPGVLGNLQKVQNPSDAHVIFSHLHPDHSLDFPSLLVWRRYHPQLAAASRNICIGPGYGHDLLGRLSADVPDTIDNMGDSFIYLPWQPHHTEVIDRIHVTPYPVIHPTESYAIRLEEPATGKVIAYSGDSAYTEELLACARYADLFICEATWGESSEGKVPDMHISGAEAGQIAQAAGVQRLVLTHIPPWVDKEATKRAAEAHFTGPVEIAMPGMEFVV